MSVIANFSVPAEDFELGDALRIDPGIRITLESMVLTRDTIMPYFWTASEHAAAVEETLEASGSTALVTRVDEIDGRTLFRIEWDDVDSLITALLDADAVVMEAPARVGSGRSNCGFPTLTGYQSSIGSVSTAASPSS